jgi:Type II intron maturase
LIYSLRKVLYSKIEKGFILNYGSKISSSSEAANRRTTLGKNLDKIIITAPKDAILIKLRGKGIVDKNFSPIPCTPLTFQPEFIIINWFSRVAIGLLSFYNCVHNFCEVKRIVT